MKRISRFISIIIRKEKFYLLPQKAIYNEKRKLLVITDPHFGKSNVFRKAGLAVPFTYLYSDLKIINDLISDLKIKQLIILGDFFHSRSGVTKKLNKELSKWRKENKTTEIILVEGNHDKSSGNPINKLNIFYCKEFFIDNKFHFTHKEINGAGHFNFSGHVHPSVRVKIFGSSLLLPCFYITKTKALLPSFGTFTGSFQIKQEPQSKTFVIAEEKVIKL